MYDFPPSNFATKDVIGPNHCCICCACAVPIQILYTVLQCTQENCKQIYVGQTQRQLKERFEEHKTSVRKKSNNAVGDHFNGPGHTLANMNILAIEKVFTPGQAIIEKRESMWISKLEAEFRGLNRQK